jgi:hypothetical protein
MAHRSLDFVTRTRRDRDGRPPDGPLGQSLRELATRYRAALEARWERDGRLRRACGEWRGHVEKHHGDVFAGSDRDPAEAFRDVLSVDFVVSRLQVAVADRFDVTATNPDPTADAEAFSVAWDDLHVAVGADVVDSGTGSASGTDAPLVEVARDDLRAVDAAALGALYESLVPRPTRLLLGEYYTPRGVADLALRDLDPDPDDVVLDPGCGAGVFLTAAVERRAAETTDWGASGATGVASGDSGGLLGGVVGIDLNPVAVRSARLALLLALVRARDLGVDDTAVDEPVVGDDTAVDEPVVGDDTAADEPVVGDDTPIAVDVPVYVGDAVGLTGDAFEDLAADVVVGNPPWLTWDRLTDPVQARWRDGPIAELDLFPHRGAAARLGFGNDDVSVAYALTAVDRYLEPGGRAGFVLKRGLWSGPAGRGFRRLAVGDRRLALSRVHDFGGLSPFGGEVGSDAALYLLADDGGGEADPGDRFPVPLTDWTAPTDVGDDAPADAAAFDSLDAMAGTLERRETDLRPVAPDDPADAWVRGDAERRAMGECDYTIRHGVKDDAKAVYSVDEGTLDRIETDHVYPYLRSKHVVKYGLFGHDRHLVPLRRTGDGDPDALARESPETYAYLEENRERLEARGSSWFDDDPFYDLFGLGPYTWADYKVVWCRLGFKPHFAVVSTVEDPVLGEKPVVPGDHFMFVGTDDPDVAHYLCALLNSAPYQRCLRDVVDGGKSSLSKSVVSRLWLPEWRGTDTQRALAARSREAHDVVPAYTDTGKRQFNRTEKPDLASIQAEIDRLAESHLADRGDSTGSADPREGIE